jgi:hypothetical protein
MASELEMLMADIREAQAHLAVWPNDSFGLKRLIELTAILEAVTPPAMSHQRERVKLDQPLPAVPAKPDKAPWDKGFKVPEPEEWHTTVRMNKPPVQVEKPRYTFGADYEQDQKWIEADRRKCSGLREEDRTLPRVWDTSEPDKFLFPMMAFNLTGMHNLNYGTSRY